MKMFLLKKYLLLARRLRYQSVSLLKLRKSKLQWLRQKCSRVFSVGMMFDFSLIKTPRRVNSFGFNTKPCKWQVDVAANNFYRNLWLF